MERGRERERERERESIKITMPMGEVIKCLSLLSRPQYSRPCSLQAGASLQGEQQ